MPEGKDDGYLYSLDDFVRALLAVSAAGADPLPHCLAATTPIQNTGNRGRRRIGTSESHNLSTGKNYSR